MKQKTGNMVMPTIEELVKLDDWELHELQYRVNRALWIRNHPLLYNIGITGFRGRDAKRIRDWLRARGIYVPRDTIYQYLVNKFDCEEDTLEEELLEDVLRALNELEDSVGAETNVAAFLDSDEDVDVYRIEDIEGFKELVSLALRYGFARFSLMSALRFIAYFVVLNSPLFSKVDNYIEERSGSVRRRTYITPLPAVSVKYKYGGIYYVEIITLSHPKILV